MDNRERMNLRIKKRHRAAEINGRLRVKNPAALKEPTDAEFSVKIKARDGKCMGCGTWHNLTTHHILGRGPGKNVPENGITLCLECHELVEGRRKKNGNEAMIGILCLYINAPEWIWDDTIKELFRRVAIRGKDYAIVHKNNGDRVVYLNGQPLLEQADK